MSDHAEDTGTAPRAPLFEHVPGEAPEAPAEAEATLSAPAPEPPGMPRAGVAWDSVVVRPTIIKVIGVGGGGCNAVQSMAEDRFDGVEFYALNTDFQALQRCTVPNRIQIGEALTSGCGSGANPSIGERAARDAEEQIREILRGADMVFITAGMGGGTGTGAAPVVAEIARSMNILTVAVVTKPFTFEGAQRMRRAMAGIKSLTSYVDTMIVLLNDKLMESVGPKTALTDAFEVANLVLSQGIKAISDLIALPGLINVDFQDVRTIMRETGGAVMGVGESKGENRAREAVKKACHSPLQEKMVIDGARGVLINITGPPSITMHEINEATSIVYEAADPEANVIFGVVIDERMQDQIRVTLIATGFGQQEGPAGAFSGPEEKLRLRSAPPAPAPQPVAQIKPVQPAPAPYAEPERPAIVARREREEPVLPPKIDFKSPDNPLSGWGNGTPEHHGAINGESGGVATKMLADGGELHPQHGPVEDPYEIPALQRRRRNRFFE